MVSLVLSLGLLMVFGCLFLRALNFFRSLFMLLFLLLDRFLNLFFSSILLLNLLFRLLLNLVSNLPSFLYILRCFAALLLILLSFSCCLLGCTSLIILLARLFACSLLLIATFLLEDHSLGAHLHFKLLAFSIDCSLLLKSLFSLLFFKFQFPLFIADFAFFSEPITFLKPSSFLLLDSLVSELLVLFSLCLEELHATFLGFFLFGLSFMPFISWDALVLLRDFEELEVFFYFLIIEVEIDAKLLDLIRLNT